MYWPIFFHKILYNIYIFSTCASIHNTCYFMSQNNGVMSAKKLNINCDVFDVEVFHWCSILSIVSKLF